ncbi:hypothetical protein SteCoe_2683 [Stentor coeruleus]|uniref:Endonuclease/exonuclease/phosphatase domain-containing protein n=1 Tax=Stentor coeruleus TaxID=5963 RepID=A0A1R2CYW8_9CILI|nr:hypothetical protein SteCoe_2683 [Stentor coeruleus]
MIQLFYRSLSDIQSKKKILSVLQWNTLSDKLSNRFPAVNPDLLKWEHRRQKIIQKLKNFSSDILCLQEIDHYHDFFKLELENLGFYGIYQQRGKMYHDGCCIFYKNNIKNLERYKINFPEHQNAIGVLLDFNNILFYVFSIHLNPNINNDHIRKHQIETLINYISILKPYPVLICGDFNNDPSSIAYKTIYNNSIGLKSIFLNNEPEFTTIKFNKTLHKKTVDYIWIRDFKVISSELFPNKNTISETGLPNEDFPSDHLALYAMISI